MAEIRGMTLKQMARVRLHDISHKRLDAQARLLAGDKSAGAEFAAWSVALHAAKGDPNLTRPRRRR